MDPEQYVRELAEANRNGFGFLMAYGLTWLGAAAVGWQLGDRRGSYAALFQGVVALPLALLLTLATGQGPRPTDTTLSSLSVYLSMGQLLAVPVVIVLIAAVRYTSAVATLALILAVHFVPYAWLYASSLYLVVASVIALGTAVLIHRDTPGAATVPRICAMTGGTLLLGSVVALNT